MFYGKLSKKTDAVVVIMAGGSGTRFWPLSRGDRPKQFLKLTSPARTLIQETTDRVKPLVDHGGLLVVTGERHRKLVEEQLPGVAVIAEPIGRNTAPCVGLAALRVLNEVGDVPMLCLPADHLIVGEEALLKTFSAALTLAEEADYLVTIGIKPTAPETGYGYMRVGIPYDLYSSRLGVEISTVSQFVEKPNLSKAQEYLASSDYLWNSGMFAWRPSVLLREIEKFIPELAQGLQNLYDTARDLRDTSRANDLFAKLPAVSIDYGVMEKTEKVALIKAANFSWNDVGSWSSWTEVVGNNEGDKLGNVSRGEALFVESKSCSVIGGKRLVAMVGLDNIVVVDTEDAILVCDSRKSQEVREIVALLNKSGKNNLL